MQYYAIQPERKYCFSVQQYGDHIFEFIAKGESISGPATKEEEKTIFVI